MILRGINFGRVWGASGVQGFFGEGYWYHRWLQPFGLDFSGATFVAKTTTFSSRQGNMPLRRDYTPWELFPSCIKVWPSNGLALNSVDLSGPGARVLLEQGGWQEREKPFVLSFMSVADSLSARLDELGRFVELLGRHLPNFKAPVALQMNFSCPNVAVYNTDTYLVAEILQALEIASELNIPLVPKLNVLVAPKLVYEVSKHFTCDAICVSNTLPWDSISPDLRQRLFGSTESPLQHLGGGGVSGRYLLNCVIDWIERVRACGYAKPINGGGGILCRADALKMMRAVGTDGSIFLGSIAFLRPWRVHGIIKMFS